VTATPTSKGKDRTVSAGSESASDAVEPEVSDDATSTGGGAVKKTSAVGQKREEVKVSVPAPGDEPETKSDVKVAGKTQAPANDTVTDLAVLPDDEGDPNWAAATEPAGSVFAGRTETPPPPPPQATPGPPPPAPHAVGAPGAPGAPGPARKPPGTEAKARKAQLQVSRFEPLSVMKFSFVMSLVCFVVLLVAVTVLYMILSGLGVFDSISSTINNLTQDQNNKSSFDASSWFSFSKVFGYTALIGGLNVLIITALSTVWSVIYNIAADFVGGVEVTLKEAE
jgi:hypothetical protein